MPWNPPGSDEVAAPAIARQIWLRVDAALTAVRELTVLGRAREPAVGPSALFYPLVGLVIGGVWLATDAIAGLIIGRLGASACVLAISLALTGGQTMAGAARTLAAVVTPRRRHQLELMEGPLLPSVIVCGAGIIALELVCLANVDRLRPLALVSAPLLGRWSMVVLAFASRAARADGRRVKFAPAVTFREFGWASTVTFALLFAASGFLGVVLALVAALVTVGLRLLLHRRLDGITRASLGAACELTQLVPLALLALF